jgi:hypothetical protein
MTDEVTGLLIYAGLTFWAWRRGWTWRSLLPTIVVVIIGVLVEIVIENAGVRLRPGVLSDWVDSVIAIVWGGALVWMISSPRQSTHVSRTVESLTVTTE